MASLNSVKKQLSGKSLQQQFRSFPKSLRIKWGKHIIPLEKRIYKDGVGNNIHKIFVDECTGDLAPVMIYLRDSTKEQNNIFIANINKMQSIRGNEVVKFALALCRIFNAEAVKLFDGAKIDDTYISTISFLTKGYTFYSKFGFVPCSRICDQDINSKEFKQRTEHYMSAMNSLRKKVLSYKVEDVYKYYNGVLIALANTHNKNLAQYGKEHPSGTGPLEYCNVVGPGHVSNIYSMLTIISGVRGSFINYMQKLQNNDIASYKFLYEELIDTVFGFKIGGKQYVNHIKLDFAHLFDLVHDTEYILKL